MPAPFTVIRGGRLLDAPGHRAEPADILIVGGTIREIGPPGLAAPDGATVVDAAWKLLMPGLVNGHCHGHGALAKGMAGDDWTLETFLNAGPGISGNRTEEDKFLCGLICGVEMVRKGVTACYDLFFEFPSPSLEGMAAIGRGYDEVGVRAVIAPMIADFTLYQALPGLIDVIPAALRPEVDRIRLAPTDATLAACEAAFRAWPFPRERIRPAIAPTIPLHCSDDFMKGCRDLAREWDLPLQTHLAESKSQAVLGLRKYGKSLTAHIDAMGLIGPSFSAAHGIWLEGTDLDRIAAGGGGVIHNPMSNMRVGSGLARIRPMLDRKIPVGVATDGVNTSDSLNMFEAQRLASFISRVQDPDYRTWLRPEEVFAMATEGSARAMGWEGFIGKLAPGFAADIVLIDLKHIHYVPLADITRQLVFSESGAAVDSVMIGGRLVLDRGRLTTVDEERIRTRAEAAVERLRAANATARAFTAKLHDAVGLFCVGLCREAYPIQRFAGD